MLGLKTTNRQNGTIITTSSGANKAFPDWNSCSTMPVLRHQIPKYQFQWKFTNLLLKNNWYSNTVLYISLFSRMTPAIPQVTEFCLLTKEIWCQSSVGLMSVHSEAFFSLNLTFNSCCFSLILMGWEWGRGGGGGGWLITDLEDDEEEVLLLASCCLQSLLHAFNHILCGYLLIWENLHPVSLLSPWQQHM